MLKSLHFYHIVNFLAFVFSIFYKKSAQRPGNQVLCTGSAVQFLKKSLPPLVAALYWKVAAGLALLQQRLPECKQLYHQGHGQHRQQGSNCENMRSIAVIHAVFLALQGAHRSRGGRHQQHYHQTNIVRDKRQRQEQQTEHQRYQNQLYGAHIIHTGITEGTGQVSLCHADTGGNHPKRRIQPGDVTTGGLQQLRKVDTEKEQQQADDNADHGRRGQLSQQRLPVMLSRKEQYAVCPGEHENTVRKAVQ